MTNLFAASRVHRNMGLFSQVTHAVPDVAVLAPDVRTVIADDDAMARNELRGLLAAESGIHVVAECADGTQTVAAVQALRPDLLLFNLRVHDAGALSLLSSIPTKERPLLIVTSAHDRYALHAFDAGALDYLVKPLDRRRLHTAIERTRAEILKANNRDLTHKLLDLLAGARSGPRMDRRLVVKSGGKVILLTMEEIDWIEAAANYVRLKAGAQFYLMREGISRVATRLDPNQFVRIHRSIIVNVRRIKELHPCNRGEYMVVLQDGKQLSCSRSYRPKLQAVISSTSAESII